MSYKFQDRNPLNPTWGNKFNYYHNSSSTGFCSYSQTLVIFMWVGKVVGTCKTIFKKRINFRHLIAQCEGFLWSYCRPVSGNLEICAGKSIAWNTNPNRLSDIAESFLAKWENHFNAEWINVILHVLEKLIDIYLTKHN